jgi:predicted nucleotidyltransferase
MSFKEITPWFKEVFMLVDDACKTLNIPLYLIGAQARHFHLAEQGIKPGRGTMDIDFAIMLPDMDIYETLKNDLLTAGFRKVTEPYRMIHDKTNTVIDLLPFGEIEEKGTVKFTDRKTEVSVIGLKEILLTSETRQLDEETVIQVTPLAGIIILKLISFDEKPERIKDLDDIHDIIIHYFEINSDRFYEILPDVMEEFDSSRFMLEAGAWLTGYDIGQILASHNKLKDYILRILENEIKQEAGKMSRYFYNKAYFDDIESVKRVLYLIIMGIENDSKQD